MVNMISFKPSHRDLFEDEMQTRMEALLTRRIVSNKTIMYERQEAMYSTIKDIYS